MSSNSYHSCAVRECKNTSIKTPGKLWIKVPSVDTDMRKIWLNLARRDPNSMSPKSPLYFCEDHFDLENDMENYMQYKIMGSVRTIRMKPECVPSKFDCQVNPKPKSSKPCRTKWQQMSNIQDIDNQDVPDIRNVANTADEGVKVFPVQDHKAVQINVKEVAKNAEIYQEPPEKRHRPFKNPSQTESSNEDTDDNVEGVTQHSILQQIKIEPETEERIVKEEPVEYYDSNEDTGDKVEGVTQPSVLQEIKKEPNNEERIVKEEPVEYYEIKIEPETEERIVKEEPVEYYNEQAQIDPISTEVKVEPPNDEMNESAYNHTMTDQPAEPIGLTDLPLPSRSNVLTEAQDAVASTSATPLAEPPTITAPKTKAQKQREYRQRIAASRTSAQAIAERKLAAERQRNCRLRKAVCLVSGSLESSSASTSRSAASRTPAQAIAEKKSAAERQRNCRLRKAVCLVSGSLESSTASSSRSGSNDVQTDTQHQLIRQEHQTSAAESDEITDQRGTSSDQIELKQAQSTWNTKWASSIMRFKSTFLDNDFGYACSVCDRLWFKNDLKPITAAQLEVISEWFVKENRRLCSEEYEMVCNTCKRTLNKKSMPPLAKANGFSYPEQPPGLPPLDPISERLISPRLPFMQVRRLRHDFSYGIIGQVINVPVDEQEMVKCLPRQLNEDDVININLTRNLAHTSVYISGYMSKSTISAWLTVLQKSPLYRLYDIDVDLSRLHPTVPFPDEIQDDMSKRVENISDQNTPESEILASRQHTMMWNGEDCLKIALGHQATPLDIIDDRHAEELSFPSIYFGEPRRINKAVPVTPHMIANSEIRRRDRRGATPQKILYVAMKILRLRMVNGIHSTFRNVSVTENVTRRMLEDTEFLKEHGIQNLAFMKAVPNSVQYWASRKRDLFAMIRQLGKPTVLLTISANEIRWLKLLTILLKLSKKYPEKTAKDLNTSERCALVSDDPVTCCVYFYKLVGSLMKMLKSKQSYNPFGKYFVKDYFLRIGFQHQGSPLAHILLWLNDDPRETVSENMPRTIDLVEKLSSVARDEVPNDSIYANQIHKHTFSCTERGETTCRFGIPYWPMPTTRVLVPIPQSDGHRQTLQQKAKELRTSLIERRYVCMDDFLNANGLTYVSYLDIVRSTLRRPTLLFRRNFDELMTNTFNPYLAGEVNSNIAIQFILEEYSCAEYIVEYVNKSARGMSNIRRELTTMMQEHPDQDYTGQLEALCIKLLNAVEMSAQEAAWYLLRQPMSETSRQIVYIPTVWPTERQRCRKRRQQMDREGIDGDSTDVWTKNIIQRYEERPASLEQVYLAEFASWYANANDFVDEEDDVHVDDEDSEAVPEARTSKSPREYRRRPLGRVIRYRRYDIDDTVNYKREMVLLYVQFRNEITEILDENNFLQLFDDNKDTIMERHSLFETNLNFEIAMKELEAMMILQNDDNSNLQEEESRAAFVQRLFGEDGTENVDDVNQIVPRQGLSIVKKRSNVMTKQQYCELVRTANSEQADHTFPTTATPESQNQQWRPPEKRRANEARRNEKQTKRNEIYLKSTAEE